MPIEVDPSQVHSIEVDPSQIAPAPAAKAQPSTFDAFLGHVREFANEAVGGLNPLKLAQGAADTLRSTYTDPDTGKVSLAAPAKFATNMAAKNAEALTQAKEAWKRGDYTSAAVHAFNYLVPFGSALNEQTNDIEAGHIGRGLGKAFAFGAQMALPEAPPVKNALSKAVDLTIGGAKNPNPVVDEAVQFGQQNDIPVSAKTATGNKFVAGVQQLADHSPIGSVIAQRAGKAQADAFRRVGGGLAERAAPGPSVAPTQAGSEIADQLHSNIQSHAAEADDAYSQLREIEADPANVRNVQTGTKQVPALDAKGQTIPGKFTTGPVMEDIPLPVDLRDVKAQLKPVYAQLTRQLPITQQRMSTGMKALENILSGPDAAPASIVDRDLSAIKAAARGDDEVPEMRTLSQGLAAHAVSKLHDAVTEAVGRAERTPTISATDEYGDTVSQPAIGAKKNEEAAAGAAPGVSVSGAPEEPAAQPDAAQQGAANPQPDGSGPQSARSPQTTVTVPGESTKYGAHYEVRELADVQPSHNGTSFSPNPRYAYRNDRNYGNPANQRKIAEWSTPAQFDPAYHITDNPDASNGPALIDDAGNVLGGNGRTMILQRVYAENPKGAAAYRSMLEDRAAHFGIDPQQISGMKQPVLVRVIDDAHLDSPAAAQDAVTNFNKVGTAALTPAEQAIADARRVSPETIGELSQRMHELGPESTLAQAIEGRPGVDVLHRLISDGVISPQEAAKYATEDSLTQAGKQRISQLMLGRFFRDPEQVDNLPPAIKGKVERLAGPLAKLEAEGDFSLTDHVKDAIDLLERARTSGLKLEEYLQQGGLLTKQQYSPEAQAIAHGLTHGNPLALVEKLNDYAEHARYANDYQGPGLFGDLPDPHTPRGAFNAAFGTSIPEGATAPPPEPVPIPKPSNDFADSFKAAPQPETKTAPPIGARVGTSAGAEAIAALERGRAATRAKVESAATLGKLPGKGVEGRQVFDQALWANDAGIERLKRIAKETPTQIPRLGRAYLEDLLDQASTEGGFDKTKTIFGKWQKLGPETKQLLFPNPMLRRDLDNFFLLAKKAGEVTNPSESATVGSIMAGAGFVYTNPAIGVPIVLGSGLLSKMLHSPAGIRALTEGLTVSVADKARAVIAANRILKATEQVQPESPRGNVIPFPVGSMNQSGQMRQPGAASNQ